MPKTIITDELYDYTIKLGVHESKVLAEVRHKTDNMTNAIMQIPQEQGQFMKVLAKSLKARKYLEIGVFTGYSSLAMAEAMGVEAEIFALDNSVEFTDIAREFWIKAGVSKQINLMIGDALDSLDKLVEENHTGTFDIAFIDAKKSDYIKYYEYCYTLVKAGGVILIDNTLFYGEVAMKNPSKNFVKSIQEFNQYIYNDVRVEMSLLPIADGLTIAYKK
jgi:predicted O-methyltransferase YrrM